MDSDVWRKCGFCLTGFLAMLAVGIALNLLGILYFEMPSGRNESSLLKTLLRLGDTTPGHLANLKPVPSTSHPAASTNESVTSTTSVYISYIARQGLCNQLFAHLNALALARFMNATLALAAGQTRDKSGGGPRFSKTPLRTLLDVDQMVPYWQARGLPLKEDSEGLQGCMQVDILRNMPRSPPEFYLTLPQAAGLLQTNITGHLEARERLGQGPPACIHVHAADIFLLLDQQSSITYLNAAASGMFYNPDIRQVAQHILSALRIRGHTSFWGVHLRLEGDWGLAKQHGQGLPGYINTMKRGHFSSTSPVYFASGVFSYWNQTAVLSMEQEIKSNGVMGAMYHKETFLEPSILQRFNPEQQALLDMLVLVEAEEFVGHPWSTYACYLRELRAMRGLPRSTFYSLFGQVGKRYFFGPAKARRH